MSSTIDVGILGATGVVGQNYLALLSNHPWFRVVHVASSPASAGKRYADAVAGRWRLPVDIPETVRDLIVQDANDTDGPAGTCRLLFSAVDMEKNAVAAMESAYAARGFAVVSNNSAHRATADVPMVIPEVNPGHLDALPAQRRAHGWAQGFIVVKPNCSIQSYLTPVHALIRAGYPVRRVLLTTLQALSGAGYPGPAGLDVVDNVIPFIRGEEEKSEQEPLKILGRFADGAFVNATLPVISAHCNRVPVIHGHTACVSVEFSERRPALDDVIAIWEGFRSEPQELGLPSAPKRPIIYRREIDRPQPRLDRDAERGMAVTVGRLRRCAVFDLRFVGLHHNTIRGAAGGCILTAELLKARGYVG